MKEKIVISPSNEKAVTLINSLKEKKTKLQKHFAQSGSKLPSLKVSVKAS